MDINIFPDIDQTANASANIICDFVKNNPSAVITYATGNTYLPVYQLISEKVKAGKADFSKTFAFHLDEYYPCPPDAPHSFVGYLRELVFNPLNIKKDHIFEINGTINNPQEEVGRYRKLIKKYPSDLVILGIGPGGHLAFDEAGSTKESRFRLVDLSKDTIYRDRVERKQNSPGQAFTWGIADILKGKKIILTAYGTKNSQYIKKALTGKISSDCPASFLQLVRDRATFYLDKEAASLL